jgi:hypothetical protein
LTVLQSGNPVLESGNIGNGPDGAADVNYYQFTITNSATVQLTAQNNGVGNNSTFVISLYDTDPYDPIGNRLIAQDDGAAHQGGADISINLAAGVYYVAVSGSGNRYFNPYLENSGYNGETGDYQLAIDSADIPTSAGDGPTVLRTEPADGTVLHTSPLLLRAALSAPVDPSTLQPDATIQLYYDPTDPFTSSNVTQLSVGSVNYDDATQEVEITPSAPLGPGYYRLVLLGNTDVNSQVVETADAIPIPLGATSAHPDGQDFTATFQVDGIEGDTSANPGPDDTPATAHQLGNVTNVGLVQATGIIGDDASDQAFPFDPADVDLYHFQVAGAGNFAFGAEVFANRVGSQLGASMQLYRMQADGSLVEVASNDGSGNPTTASNFTVPLFSDPVVYASVTAGDYYLAVTSQFNTYDPTVSHSGSGGFSSGPYVLNLRVDPSSSSPHVLSTNVTEGAVLNQLPTTLTVQFDEAVNLQPLAFQSYLHAFTDRISAVYLRADDGTQYFPRLESFDPTTNTATFLLIDALPNGNYTWHLSGPNGLDDFAGNPLVGNDPVSGDYLVHFTVDAPPRGTPGNPTLWESQDVTDPQNPQTIGPLFPMELQNGVVIDRAPGQDTTAQKSAADYYEITVLQSRQYLFTLSNITGLGEGTAPTIWLDGVQQATIPQGANGSLAQLDPGTYVIGVDWSGQSSSAVSYQLNISIIGSPEPATSLTTGPVPALRLRLATDSPPPAPPGGPGTVGTPPSPSQPATPTGGPPVDSGTPAPAPGSPSSPAPANNSPGGVTQETPVTPTGSAPDSPQLSVTMGEHGVVHVSVVTPAVVEANAGASSQTALIPSTVVIALSDRALGASGDPGGARVFLRETNTPTVSVADNLGPLLLASPIYLSISVDGTAANTPATGAWPLFGDLVVTGVIDLEIEVVRAVIAGKRDLPQYVDSLARQLDGWQPDHRVPEPSPTPVPQAVDGTTVAVEEVVEAPADAGPAPWYYPGQIARVAVLVVSMTLVALRIHSRRSSRTAPPAPTLGGEAPSDH